MLKNINGGKSFNPLRTAYGFILYLFTARGLIKGLGILSNITYNFINDKNEHACRIIVTLNNPFVVFYYHKCTIKCQICSLRIEILATSLLL